MRGKTIFKKNLVLFCIIALLSMTLTIPVFAAAPIVTINTEAPSLRAEETMWYFRVYNGVRQRRLWSITYGYWKTAWMKL